MKPALLLALALPCIGQEIDLHNKAATFTNLEGRVFQNVTLSRADLDGVIWRDGASAGRVCFTNLDASLIESWGIPTNRIGIAAARASKRATDAQRERLGQAAAERAEAIARSKSDAAEAAAAPARDLLAQKKAAAQPIYALENDISAARAKIRRAEAIAHDYNAANTYNDAPYVFIKDTERVKIEEAQDRLRQMKSDFSRKYGAWPPQP